METYSLTGLKWGTLYIFPLLNILIGVGNCQDTINCFLSLDCSESSEVTTVDACCGVQGLERSYSMISSRQCIQCPTIFGFNQSTFTGKERTQPYAVEVGFIQGLNLRSVSFKVILLETFSTFRGRYVSDDISFNNNSVIEIDPSHNPTALIYFQLNQDGVAQEYDKIFLLRIIDISLELPSNVITMNQLNGTMVDSDLVTFGFQSPEYVLTEGEDDVLPVEVVKSPNVRLANQVCLNLTAWTVDEALAAGIGDFRVMTTSSLVPAGGSDFNVSISRLCFPPDEGRALVNTINVLIDINDDAIDEADEYFIMTLRIEEAVALDTINVRNDSFSIGKIIDNDVCQIEFSGASDGNTYTVTEPTRGTSANYTIVLTKKSDCKSEQTIYVGLSVGPTQTVRVSSATLDTTTTTNDYNIGGLGIGFQEISFLPDEQNKTFTIYLNSDSLFEGTEYFDIVLTNSRIHTADIVERATVIILDSDNIVIGFTRGEYFATESDESVEVCVVVLNPPINQPLLFNPSVLVTNITGTANESDYTFTRRRVVMSDEVRRVCISITLNDDALPEDREFFEVQLSVDGARSNSVASFKFSPKIANITIADDDRRCPSTVQCFNSADCGDGNATNTTEIECCNHASDPLGIAFQCTSDQSTSKLCYTCPVVFGFDTRELTLSERLNPYSIPVRFEWGHVSNATVSVRISHQSTDVEDVQLITQSLHFSTGVLQRNVHILIVQDFVAQEQDDYFFIILNTRGASFPANAEVTRRLRVIIKDTDEIQISLSERDYSVTEGNNVPVMVIKDPAVRLANDIVLRVNPRVANNVNSNPLSPARASLADFNATSFTVVFPADASLNNPIRSVDAFVQTYDDRINEATQVFMVILSVISAVNTEFVQILTRRSNCFIRDNDPFYVGFSKTSYTVYEEDILTAFTGVVLTTTNESEQTFNSLITVLPSSTATVINGSGSYDFSLGALGRSSTSKTFYPEETIDPQILIGIAPDDIYEGPETIELCQAPQTGYPQYQVLGNTCTTITIIDNEKIVMGFESTSYFVNESAGFVNACVLLTKPSQDEILGFTLDFVIHTRPGSADFYEFGGGVSGMFLPNSSHRECLQVSIFDDQTLEDTETFFLDLSLYEDQQKLILHEITPNVSTVYIIDDDGPIIGFGNMTYYFAEDRQVQQVAVGFGVLSGALQVAIPLWLNTSAMNPDDIRGGLRRQQLFVVDSNHTMITVTFTIVADDIFEVTEKIQLSLAFAEQPPDRVTINPNMAVVNIVDGNELFFRFDETQYSIDQQQASVNLTVELITGNLEEYSVILQAVTQNGTALAGIDFVHTSIRLQFDSIERELPVEVPILDSDATSSRTFSVKLSFVAVVDSSGEELNVTTQELERIRLDTSANPVEVTIVSRLISTTSVTAINASSNNNVAILASTLSVVLSLIAILICCFIACLCWFRAKKKESQFKFLSEFNGAKESDYNPYDHMEMNKVQSSFRLKISQHLMINSRNLKMEETVGQGQFGIVYKAYLTKGYSQSYNEIVAVKTLKGFFDKNLVRGLLVECSKMAEFDHPNVLTLTGVCLDGGPAPYIVMPFMFNGSLLSYLSKNREALSFPIEDSPVSEEIQQASLKLTDICLQIAKGMEYLASKRVIHRDLATRNCMVDMNFVIKVSDFGLSETINPSKDYFRHKEEGVKLPFKWMPPESLDEGIFSEKSDVWSYGVTCWEVFSVGKTPYSGINPADLSPMLQSGYRMDKPFNAACPDTMYEILIQCWKAKSEDRPHFSDLVPDISKILEASAGYLSFSDTAIETESSDYHSTHFAGGKKSSIQQDDNDGTLSLTKSSI